MRLRYVEGFLRWLEKERRSEGSVRERRTKWWKEQGEEDTTVVENRGARRQGGKYKTAPPARVSTVIVERTRRTRHFFERKLQALLRGLFFTYFGFLFLFVTSSCKIFNNRYIVLRVIVCYYRKKSERSIVFNERHEKRIVERKKREKPAKEYEIKKIREDAIVRTTEKEFVSVFVTYIVVCPIFILFFLHSSLSFVLVRSHEEISQCLVPVFVYLSRLAAANGEKLH